MSTAETGTDEHTGTPRTFTDEQAVQIREDYANGVATMSALAGQWGTTATTISKIIHWRAYKTAGGPPPPVEEEPDIPPAPPPRDPTPNTPAIRIPTLDTSHNSYSNSGRPPLLEEGWDPEACDWDPESRPGVCIQAFAEGASIRAASGTAGFDRARVTQWLSWGRDLEPGDDADLDDYGHRQTLYVWFARRVAQAEAELQMRAVHSWVGAMKHDWRAAEKFLARRFPAEWGEREHHVVTGANGGPIQLEQAQIEDIFSDPRVAELIDQIESSVAEKARGEIIDADIVED